MRNWVDATFYCHQKEVFTALLKVDYFKAWNGVRLPKYDNLRMVYCLFYSARQDWHVVSGTVTGI